MNKYIIPILMIVYNSSFSQNNEGEIEDAQILIEKNSKIILPKVDKVIEKLITNKYIIDKQSFEFSYLNYQVPGDNKKIDKFIRLENIKKENSKNNLRLQLGNYSSFLIQSSNILYNNKDFTIHSNLYHKSNLKGYYYSDNSRFNESDINIGGKYIKRKNSFDFLFDYKKITTGYSGYLESLEEINYDEIKVNISKYLFDIKYSYNDNNFSTTIENKNIIYKDFLYQEFNNLTILNLNYKLSDEFNIKLKFLNDYYHIYSFDDMIINTYNLSLLFKYNTKNLYLSIGGKLNKSSKEFKKTTKMGGLYPHLNIKYKINNFSIKLFTDNGLVSNKYSDKIFSNPFVYDKYLFSVLNNNVENSYNGLVEYQINNNAFLNIKYSKKILKGFTWYISNVTSDYLTIAGNPVNAPIYLYLLKRYDEKIYIDQLSFSLKIPFNSFISPSFDFSYIDTWNKANAGGYITKDNIRFYYMPKYSMNFENLFIYKKVKSIVGINLLLDSYSQDFNSKSFRMDNYVNLFLNSEYELNNKIILELNIKNILNKKNEYYYMYPELGFNVMLGAFIKF